ncbi:MAG: hypothetical protein J6U54_11460 [Clostridiales bacterium]|nr:hypothetical protein [Clostridiales bacterium]
MSTYIIPDRSQVWLAHHGIAGQKWGHRNGPPYPLDEKDHSAAEKKAGWKKSLDNDKKDESNNKSTPDKESDDKEKFWTDSRKKMAKRIAIGAGVVAGTCLAVYGAKKLNDSAVEGLTKSYKYAAQQSLQLANDQRRSLQAYTSNTSGIKKGMESARQVSKDFQNKAKDKNYSLKEKIDYHVQKAKVKGDKKQLDYNNVYGMSKMAEKYNDKIGTKQNGKISISEAYKKAAKEATRAANELEKKDSVQNRKSVETYRQIAKEYQNKIKNKDYNIKDRADFQLSKLKVKGERKNLDYNTLYGVDKLQQEWVNKLKPESSAAEGARYTRAKLAKKYLGNLRKKR